MADNSDKTRSGPPTPAPMPPMPNERPPGVTKAAEAEAVARAGEVSRKPASGSG